MNCKYCENEKCLLKEKTVTTFTYIYIGKDKKSIQIDIDDGDGYMSRNFNIVYCPMCGKKL